MSSPISRGLGSHVLRSWLVRQRSHPKRASQLKEKFPLVARRMKRTFLERDMNRGLLILSSIETNKPLPPKFKSDISLSRNERTLIQNCISTIPNPEKDVARRRIAIILVSMRHPKDRIGYLKKYFPKVQKKSWLSGRGRRIVEKEEEESMHNLHDTRPLATPYGKVRGAYPPAFFPLFISSEPLTRDQRVFHSRQLVREAMLVIPSREELDIIQNTSSLNTAFFQIAVPILRVLYHAAPPHRRWARARVVSILSSNAPHWESAKSELRKLIRENGKRFSLS